MRENLQSGFSFGSPVRYRRYICESCFRQDFADPNHVWMFPLARGGSIGKEHKELWKRENTAHGEKITKTRQRRIMAARFPWGKQSEFSMYWDKKMIKCI